MNTSSFRILVILAVIWGSAAIAHTPSPEPLHSKSQEHHITPAVFPDPCWTSGPETTTPSGPSPRARVSRRSAIYVIQHVQKACGFLRSTNGDSKSALLAPQLSSILEDLHATILDPIYRSHPDLQSADLQKLPSKLPQARPRDIRRATAGRLSDGLTRIQQKISKVGAEGADEQPNKEAALAALQPFTDAAAELSFAEKIAFDAYLDLFAKKFSAIPDQPRTEESDAAYRKRAPPLGSVRLSDSALLLVESFMRQARRAMPKDDQVASIGWVRAQRSKGPNDADWIDQGPGWVLGAYSRTQVPPDVIDKVRGVEIVFTPEDPSSLAGKIVDAKNRNLFVHD
jgi:hypothetical protein